MDKKTASTQLRKASSIILVRENSIGLEVYLLKRSNTSKFMGGVYVFPGGAVDFEDKDFNLWQAHIDVDRCYIEAQLMKEGYSFEDILGFCIAGIRETLEEAGVFLAGGQDKNLLDIKEMAAFRLKQDYKEQWFNSKVMNDNWILSISNLKKWSHWITPEAVKKRFDTLFFIAVMPEGQTCLPDMGETEKGIWITPRAALEKNFQNKISLSPPTLAILNQMMDIKDLNALEKISQNRQWLDAITPRAVLSDKGPVILLPWDPMYNEARQNNSKITPQKILKPGEDFSRVWNDHGAWKPVGV